MTDYTNSRMKEAISECIHSSRDREILTDRLIDGLTFDELSDKHHISVRQCKNIVYRSLNKLIKYM